MREIVAIAVDDGIVHVVLDDGVVAFFSDARGRPGTGRWKMLPPVPGTPAALASDPEEILRVDAGEDL